MQLLCWVGQTENSSAVDIVGGEAAENLSSCVSCNPAEVDSSLSEVVWISLASGLQSGASISSAILLKKDGEPIFMILASSPWSTCSILRNCLQKNVTLRSPPKTRLIRVSFSRKLHQLLFRFENPSKGLDKALFSKSKLSAYMLANDWFNMLILHIRYLRRKGLELKPICHNVAWGFMQTSV